MKTNATSFDSILVEWKPPREELVPGIIRGYTCRYQAVYTSEDFESKLKTQKKGRRRRRAIISVPLVFEE